eukprot:COSAG02_NODE_42862_length_380_cov_0.921708_1_plen_66_part_10
MIRDLPRVTALRDSCLHVHIVVSDVKKAVGKHTIYLYRCVSLSFNRRATKGPRGPAPALRRARGAH